TGFTSSMVKDIYAGPSSAFDYSNNSGVLLPNGKFVFAANDGTHGGSPWVTDGTETGTLLLQDTDNGNYGNLTASQFNIVNGKSVYKVYHNGWDFGVSDGTVEGTKVLEAHNDYFSASDPKILGTINDKLYFTATNEDGKGLFSTDGTSFTKLVAVSDGNDKILGYTANKAYFAITDAAHGQELWAANLATGTIALTKDILAGSGGALAGGDASIMIGDKILFNAYTSGSNQALFVSDGTESGTVQLASSLPTDKAIIGNKVFFANGSGVFVSDLSATTISVTQLESSDFYGVDRLQADSDQAFFLSGDERLFVSTGSDAIELASNVDKFKVVADNAIYFIETNSSNVASLWYSDGTASGTRYIENLAMSAESYDLANAVAIHTVGVSAG
ncbi:MAG: hypothetical protein IE928_10870, partial [Gammaproteobacteria bacterium]|nr:hypothetical protein [Gammaproteobacteria bacterium]